MTTETIPNACAHDLTLDESATIELAKSGDKTAYKQLYDMHVSKVHGLACRLMGEASAAEDVTQEVFIRVWRSLKNFKGESQFSTWLHRITSNTAVDQLRKQRSWLQLVFSRAEDVASHSNEGDFADNRDLEKLIARLPERARIVFVLHTIEGYRHDEIADITRMAVGSSKAQLNRAKKLLREWLHND